jgi:oxalate decarboxylase
MSILTRRSFIGTAAAAVGSFAALQKVAGADRSRTDPGPANHELDGQNPDSIWPPATDSKSLVQNFKYPFSFANKRTYEGGWSREVTVRELPVSKTLAGVNMRLTAEASGSCIGTPPASGPSCFTGRRGLRRLTRTARVLSPM